MNNYDFTKIKCLYRGETEEFDKNSKLILNLATSGKTIPEICYILLHDYNIMSTPDSLDGWFKVRYPELKPSRKNKKILIEDDYYQAVLEERKKETGASYTCYSRTTRENKKKQKRGRKPKTIVTLNIKEFSKENLNALEGIIGEKEKSLKAKIDELKIPGREIDMNIINETVTEANKLEKELKEAKEYFKLMDSVINISEVLNTPLKDLTISYIKE